MTRMHLYLVLEKSLGSVSTFPSPTLHVLMGSNSVSANLTGNRAHPALNMDGKTSKHHVMVFDAETIKKHPDIGLSRGGMVLFALLTGGDYDKVCNLLSSLPVEACR